MPAVSCTRKRVPCQVRSTAMASRVMPASGPVSRRSSPSSRLISVDLPELGRPTTAMRIGARFCGARRRPRLRRSLPVLPVALRQRRAQRVVEIDQALRRARPRSRPARRDRARRLRSMPACAARPSLLLATRITGLPARAHQIGEGAVGRHQPGARVDHEQHRVGRRDRRVGLRLHAAGRGSPARPPRGRRCRSP